MANLEPDWREYESEKKDLEMKHLKFKNLLSQAPSFFEFTLKWKELEEHLELTRNEIQSQSGELGKREKHLEAKELKWKSRMEELDAQEKNLEAMKLNLKSEMESKEIELLGLDKMIEEKQKEFSDSQIYLSLKQTLCEQLKREIEDNEKVIGAQERRIGRQQQELKNLHMEIAEAKGLIEEYDLKRKLSEQKLTWIEKSIEKKSKLLESTERTALDRQKVREEIESKVREHCSRGKSLKELSSKLELKEKELASREKEVSSKQEELDLLNNKTLDELQLYGKQLSSLECTLKQREIQLKGDSLKLEVKERQFEAMESLQQEREVQLQAKERHLEEQAKELELAKKKSEPLEGTSASATGHCKTNIRDGRDLQLFMYEFIKFNESACTEISALVQQELFSKLVLDAVQGFQPIYDNEKFDVVLNTRACLFLMNMLKRPGVQISAEVRKEAMKLASDWKAKMTVGAENWLEISVFLQLLTSYEVTFSCDGRELQCLTNLVAQQQQVHGLSLGLGSVQARSPIGITMRPRKNNNNGNSLANVAAPTKIVNAESPAAATLSKPNFHPTVTATATSTAVTAPAAISSNNVAPVEPAKERTPAATLTSALPNDNGAKRQQEQKKRLFSAVAPSFQEQHKLQRTSISADRPNGLHPNRLNPSNYGQVNIPSYTFSMANSIGFEYAAAPN